MNVFLSPSSKDYQISPITGISEKENMTLLANAIEENLRALGINVHRASENSTPNQSVENSNSEERDLHLSLSSLRATSPDDRGINIYYSSSDGRSRDYADVIGRNLKEIYPLPDLIQTIPNGSLVEIIDTNAPAVAIFIGNQSNPKDVEWFSENVGDIGRNIAESVGEVLGINNESTPLTAIGIISSPLGYASVRKSPSPTSRVITRLQNGTPIRIIGKIGNWYAVIAKGTEGYVAVEDVSAETPEK